ncbi:trafficking protein Mon1-domain-containing protein [Microdochium trichocladiopsis]|uniref:Vacuolar fusion protein MON1 n=1 Tax=Microdochium trichocladiopsis TaxID=1682393 RepID=A0A9P9BSU2_9PEZI|nr:trafficking protein Mon1-domain-containing protein [Microdochium trichocladiopsis]KAH7034949.1 trafficking protein Mon1-domain-containing protein [Microdochium trichocladiopsis]
MTMGQDDARRPSSVGTDDDHDRPRPPLPPRPGMQSKPTTAVSSMNIQTLSFPDGTRGTFTTDSGNGGQGQEDPGSSSRDRASSISVDPDDNMSIMSYAGTARAPVDLESLMGGDASRRSPAWALLRSQSAAVQPFETGTADGHEDPLDSFTAEFDPIPGETVDGMSDDDRLVLWKSKMKHYMVLSSAGKPIWSRHGDLGLINSSMGVVQTIISFYEASKNPLQGFTAGNTRFVIATKGPLYFVAISSLGESDQQLRFQLDALYMQILSTLTLPTLTRIFVNRPSSDLRKPLQGTESLLSSLADTFTKGSPSALLGALECLKLRKSHRHAINNVFLKARGTANLLYGLIVAGGKLVSVIRPRRHSLHPSDLQLIFNMLFESGGIKAAGGENWIPLCLPAFNNQGYLYMYVSWLQSRAEHTVTTENSESTEGSSDTTGAGSAGSGASIDHDTAIILVSPDKESFFDLQKMRDDVITELQRKKLLSIISEVTKRGRPPIHEIVPMAPPAAAPLSSTNNNNNTTTATPAPPSSTISHFLFKSRANVQFTMPSLDPTFSDPIPRRKLMSLYHELHAAVHARHSHLKVLHCVSEHSASLAWVTPIFELYCVAGPNTSRAVLTQAANKIMQWARREEERIFIIGGGVF